MDERSAPPRRGRPPRLTRERIVGAARAVLDRDGLEGVTMRAVAREARVTPMALYHHVADKDELLLLVLDAEAAGLRPERLPEEPRERIVAVACAMRDVLDARPWVLGAIVPGVRFARTALPAVEQIVGAFVELGLERDDALRAYRAVWYLVAGELTVRHAGRRAAAADPNASAFGERALAEADPAELPHLTALAPRWREVGDAYDPRAAIAALVDGLVAGVGDAGGEG